MTDLTRAPSLSLHEQTASIGAKLAAAKALYAALRWSGATDTAPFADVRAAVNKTPAWEKREAYTQTEVHWLERTSESYTLYIVLLGAQAGLRVSEMTALRWEDIDLGNASLKVVAGKGGKTARVNQLLRLSRIKRGREGW